MATNFLEAAGSNGFLTAPFNLMSTELNSLTAAPTSAISSVGGSSGVFTQTNFANAIWGAIAFTAGGTITVAAAGYIAGWFLYSPDGGSTFEKTVSNTDMARQPDFIIPLLTATYANADVIQASGLVRLPWWSTKIFIVNHAGTLPATNNLIKCGPVAVQY